MDDKETSTNRSIFERKAFEEFKSKIQKRGGSHQNADSNQVSSNDFMNSEMIKIREEAIKYRQKIENECIDKMLKNNQITPRTHQQKKKDLEVWVTKEKEEVKRTQKVFKEQWAKTKEMIEQTEKNSEMMKKMLPDSGRLSSRHSKRGDHHDSNTNLNNELLSSKRTGRIQHIDSQLLGMIYNSEEDQKRRDEIVAAEIALAKRQQQEEEERQKQYEETKKQALLLKKQQEEIEKQRKIDEQKRVQLLEQQKKKDEELKKQQEEILVKQAQLEKQHQIIEQKKREQEIEDQRLKKKQEDQNKKEEQLLLKKQQDEQLLKEQQLKKEQDDRQKKLQEKKKWEDLYQQKMEAMQKKFDQSQLEKSNQKSSNRYGDPYKDEDDKLDNFDYTSEPEFDSQVQERE